MGERGVAVDHVTLYRWVQRYAPELEKRGPLVTHAEANQVPSGGLCCVNGGRRIGAHPQPCDSEKTSSPS